MRMFIAILFMMFLLIPPAAFAQAGYDDGGAPISPGNGGR